MTFAEVAFVVASAAYMVVACMAAAYTSDPVVERNSDLDHILVEASVDTCPVEDYSFDQDYNNLGPYLSSLYY